MNTVDFLFVYEVKARELESICLLGAYLRKRGYSVAYINSWESLMHPPRKYVAKVLVLSACYDDGTYAYFAGHALKFDKAVNLQWEQVLCNLYLHSQLPTSWDFSGIALHTRHVCWGERERERLISCFGVDALCTKTLGYLPLDFYRPELHSLLIRRETLFKQYGLDPAKRTLLFVSSFSTVGLPKEYLAIGNADDTNMLCDISARSQADLLEWFRKILEKHPELQILYRYHPTEANNPDIKAMADTFPGFFALNKEGIRHWIWACDAVYNWTSTSMVEMYMSGKPTFVLRPIPLPERLDMPIFSVCDCIDSYEDFEASAFSERVTFPIPEENLLQYYDIQPTPSYIRIGDWLIATLQDPTYRSPPVERTIFDPEIPPLQKMGERIKDSAPFRKVAQAIITRNPDSRLSQKLKRIERATDIRLQKHKEEQAFRERVSAYGEEKYRQNRASHQEIEEMLERFTNAIGGK